MKCDVRHLTAVCLVWAMGWTTIAAEEPDARAARIVGLGAATCRQFTADAAADPQVRKDYLAWAQGFMSGIILSRPPGVDVGLDLIHRRLDWRTNCDSSKAAARGTRRSISLRPSRRSISGCG